MESQTSRFGIMYAAVTANLKDKKCQFVGTQTECLQRNKFQLSGNKIQPQTSKHLGK